MIVISMESQQFFEKILPQKYLKLIPFMQIKSSMKIGTISNHMLIQAFLDKSKFAS
jgi:hypothetical protein